MVSFSCHVGSDFRYFAPSGFRFGSFWAKLFFGGSTLQKNTPALTWHQSSCKFFACKFSSLGPGAELLPQATEIDLFGTKSHQKIKEKTIAKKGDPSLRKGAHFGATWAILGALWPILGAIWDPAGRQGAPKIHLSQKMNHRMRHQKCMNIYSKFDGKKMKILNVLKPQNYYV